MEAVELTLRDFRNVREGVLSFSPDINFLYGDNAQGKTNALEAIYLFARGKSFRGASDKEMARFGKNGYFASLAYQRGKRREDLSIFTEGKEKVRKRNGILLEKQSELIGGFRAVLFSPDDLLMVKGEPAERRRFLDVAISQTYPVYLSLYRRYKKILEERNAMLKAMQKGFFLDKDALLAFSEGLADTAADIFLYRRDYVERLSHYAEQIAKEISFGKERLSLSYRADAGEGDKDEIKARYLHLFSAHTEREIAFGSSLFGIHRDDVIIDINEKSTREYASQGQQRSVVLALKMAEGLVSSEKTGEMPVYLFDDVLSELDEDRRRFLLSGMKGCQFIVTGCEKSILGEWGERVHFIGVKDGSFGEEK